MRTAQASHHWANLRARNSHDAIVRTVTVSGIPGLANTTFNFGSALTGLYGANGVGKTILLRAIWAALSWDDSSLRPEIRKRIHQGKVSVQLDLKGASTPACLDLTDLDNIRWQKVNVSSVYIDTSIEAPMLQRFYYSIGELEELLGAYSSVEFRQGETRLLSELLRKNYKKIELIEVDEFDDSDFEAGYGWPAIPFFRLEDEHRKYDIRSASLGEVAGLLIYWQLRRAERGSLILLEEPESFLSEISQAALVNLMAVFADRSSFSIIFTSHSSRMLAPLAEGEMRFMKSSAAGSLASDSMTLDDVRRHFGLIPADSRVVLVEDEGAKKYLEEVVSSVRPSLLAQVQIVAGTGEGWVTDARHHTPREIRGLRCVGVYDGDMRGSATAQAGKGWPALYLPGNESLELLTKRHLQADAKAAAALLNVSEAKMELAISENQGVDHHDWIGHVSTAIGLAQDSIYRKLIAYWLNDATYKEQVDELVTGLEAAWTG